MASGFTNYLKDALLNRVFRATAYAPTALQIGLSTTATTPAADGTGVTEPSGNGYARITVDQSGNIKFGTNASGGTISNSADIRFPATGTATGSWGTISHVIVWDSGGTNVLMYDDIANKLIESGESLTIQAGDFDVSIT